MPTSSFHDANSKGEKLAQRISQILARLHQGEMLDKQQLAQDFQVDVRTIDRDLGERLQGIVERNPQGYWELSYSARGTVPAKYLHGYARMTGTEHIFPNSSLSYLLQQLEIPEQRRTAQVQPVQHEDVAPAHFDALQQAISQRHPCRFTYKDKLRHAQPYRLIHKNGIWYLAAEEGGRLKNFSVALIGELTIQHQAQFTVNSAHQKYIDQQDDVWFTGQSTEVLLRVDAKVSHYFTRRALLPQQQHRLDADGSLLVTSRISHLDQLLPVVRYWLPHVRIVAPAAWHQVLLNNLQQALERWHSADADQEPPAN